MKPLLLTLAVLVAVSVGMTLVAVVYGGVTVGVPYPEPTPAQAASERHHMGVFEWLMLGAGLCRLATITAGGVDRCGVGGEVASIKNGGTDMSEVAEKLLSVVRALPEAEQREFAEALNGSLPLEDEDPALEAELDRRWQGYQSGERPGIPAEEVYRQLRAEFGKPA